MSDTKKLKLLIREISPNTQDGRIMRENLRRIKQYLDDVAEGTTTLISFESVGGSPSVYNSTDIYDVSVNNQTVFNLTGTPSNPSTSRMMVNGVEQTYGVDFTISGSVLTFDPVAAGFQMELSNEFGQPDKVIVHYMT